MQIQRMPKNGFKPNRRRGGECPAFVFAYAQLLFGYPLLVMAISFAAFLLLPIGFLHFHPLRLGNDPEKGFETDGTAYSGNRLAWTLLQPSIGHGSRVNLAALPSSQIRPKRAWADDFLSSLGSVACYDEPIPAMSFMAQFIVEVPEGVDALFSRKFLNQMCQLQEEIAQELSAFAQFSPYRTIWSFPNYAGCLIPKSRANCSFIEEEDAIEFRKIFQICLPHRQSILACHRPCQPSAKLEDFGHMNCQDGKPAEGQCSPTIPPECNEQMWFDLFYRILPGDISRKPLPINSFLPFYSMMAYRLQGMDIPLAFYTNFEAKIKEVMEDKIFNLKGLYMDTKRDLLLDAAIRDSRLALFAAFGVFLLLAIYSLSLAFAVAVLFQLSGAVLSSLAIFRLCASMEMPLLNMIAFVLLISVGSDGAFLLLDTFPRAEKLNQQSLAKAIEHTAKTMFLTQFSTVVPFLLNLLSSVFAFRSFGLFAGLTLVFNYFLLISYLPAFLVIQNRFFNPWLSRFWPSRCWYCFPGSSSSPSPMPMPNRSMAVTAAANINARISSSSPPQPQPINNMIHRVPSSYLTRCRDFSRLLLDDILPAVLIQGRFVWLTSLTLFLIVSAFLTSTQLSLPRYNPLQLFHSSNLHEYYDQNAEQLFPFVADKIAGLPFDIRLVWGIQPVRAANHFDPNSIDPLLRPNAQFKLDSPSQLQAMAQELLNIRQLPFVDAQQKFWPERFIEWMANQPSCSSSQQSSICCNFGDPLFSPLQLDHCIRFSTTLWPTGFNDTLIWDNRTHQLAGYTALLHTHLPYSHRFANLSASFSLLDKSLRPLKASSTLPGWYTTEWAVISQWFDLQNGIISDCKQSFIVSFIVVFFFSALMLRWNAFTATLTIFCIVLCTVGSLVFLGWEIGVLEGVILVLVVGLSFDYTLHFGALIGGGCGGGASPDHRIQQSVRGCIRPVGMSGLSSILAGAIMLFSETHAFFQVAVFLVVCSSLSLLFAIFFFLPIVHITSGLCSFGQGKSRSNRTAKGRSTKEANEMPMA